MQNKTRQHKHRNLYDIKKSNKAVINKRNNKILYNNNDKKNDYVPSVVNTNSDW